MPGDDKDEAGKFVPSTAQPVKDASSGEVGGEGGEPSPEAIAEWSLTGDSDVPLPTDPLPTDGEDAQATPDPDAPDLEPAQKEKRESKRQIGDTRGLGHGIIYTTSSSIAAVEDWLEDNCLGKWSLELIAMDDDLLRKRIKIMLELDSDKQSFQEIVGSDEGF